MLAYENNEIKIVLEVLKCKKEQKQKHIFIWKINKIYKSNYSEWTLEKMSMSFSFDLVIEHLTTVLCNTNLRFEI